MTKINQSFKGEPMEPSETPYPLLLLEKQIGCIWKCIVLREEVRR
jgi:hypothetical protein